MAPQLLSMPAYARHRGVTKHAVELAVQAGRITARKVGHRWQIDPARADVEWAATTDSTMAPLSKLPDPTSLAEARTRRESALAALAEIELQEKRGEVIAAADVESRLAGLFASCRTKLLGVPSRARQQDPGLTRAQIALVESLIREALEDLAG